MFSSKTDLPLMADGTLDVVGLLAMHRATFGSMRLEDDGGSGDSGAGGGGNGGSGSGGEQYTPPATQDALNAIVETRLQRERAKFAKFDEYKTKAEKHDALEAELGTAADKAAAAARKDERDKLNAENVPRLVKAEFKAAAKGLLTTEQLTALLEDLDLTKYVDDKGDVDEDKVEKKVKALAPAGNGNNNGNQNRNLGQGNQQQAQAKPGEAGRAAAQKRFGSKARSAAAAGS